MDPSFHIFLYFLICLGAVAKAIPLRNSALKETKDTQKLKQSLKILRDYLDELGIKQPPETQTEYPILKVNELGIEQSLGMRTEYPSLKVSVNLFGVDQSQKIQSTDNPSEDIFGPHYPTVDTDEPPMDLPIEGLRDDQDIPRNLFFQPIPLSDRLDQIERSGQGHRKKGIEEKILLPISVITLLASLILLGCSAFGIYECTKEKRDQRPGQTRCTQTEDLDITTFNAMVNIADEVSSYSDESEGSQENRPHH
ncbi:uncharacterized protein LOC117662002 [Pantherophis guttatus]|uniref:Uncharacterized protein LOC117662002 n=1 Tax=Pantherophis guttatus TaxID=94885 RepID=A0A6P9B7C9_PANGU|nr:uncharacterized protein LOC117662002 [Pantherophis guttatus]